MVPTLFTSGLKDIFPSERRCLFEDESYMMEETDCFLRANRRCLKKIPNILRTYSQSGCFFECMLQFAYLQCDCLPWNYPQFDLPGNRSTHLCDMQGQNCFLRNFFSKNNVPGKDQLCPFCQAYPNCELNKYEAHQTKIQIDNPAQVCGELPHWLTSFEEINQFLFQ